MLKREGLMRVYRFCKICKKRFQVTDGIGICCDACWDEYEERYGDQFSDSDVEEDDIL